MPYGYDVNGKIYAECPHCGKTAEGESEVERWFGFRTMEDGSRIPQSWCRDCRSTDS